MVNKNPTSVKIKFLQGIFCIHLMHLSFVTAHMGLDQRWPTGGLDGEPTAPKIKCHDMFLSYLSAGQSPQKIAML